MAEIRVAHVVGKMVGGGVETTLMNYYLHIQRERVQFDFIVDSDSSRVPRDLISELGGRVYVVPGYQHVSAYRRHLAELFEAERWPIVHSHINALSALPLSVAKSARVPVRISHSHSTSNWREQGRHIAKLALRRTVIPYATHRFACGELAGNWLFGKRPYTVVPNAVEAEVFRANWPQRYNLRRELSIPSSALVILNAGRFVRQKNQLFLLDILERVRKTRPEVILVIAGDGPLRNRFEAEVSRRQLGGNVRVLGQRTDMAKLYSAADVFCLPSLYEGMPVTVAECICANLPVVASLNVSSDIAVSQLVRRVGLSAPLERWCTDIVELGMTNRGVSLLTIPCQ